MKALKRIIITGADGMGKTALVRRLTSEASGPQLHYVGHDGGPITSLQDAGFRILGYAFAPPGISDRSCMIDDVVYTAALNRPTIVDFDLYDQVLCLLDPVIIFVDNDSPLISQEAKAHKSEELLEKVTQSASAIRTQYQERMSNLESLGLTVLRYDWRIDVDAVSLITTMLRRKIICVE
jgi:hypothetical protein